MNTPLRVATRGSTLARWQAERVISLLNVPAELVVITTEGDRRGDVSISSLGGAGVFVKEVEAALLEDRADIAVHSAKDLQSDDTPELNLAAFPERADPRDALVGNTLAQLPKGARIGTGAPRRRAQLAALRPDLEFGELRGNIETRVKKAADFDAVVLAAAALIRLGLEATDVLEPSVMIPQVGQGALAVQCRTGDSDSLELVSRIDDPVVRACVEAERAFLATLGGGCELPVGAIANQLNGSELVIDAVLLSVDGRRKIQTRQQGTKNNPQSIGERAANVIVQDLGGRELIQAVA